MRIEIHGQLVIDNRSPKPIHVIGQHVFRVRPDRLAAFIPSQTDDGWLTVEMPATATVEVSNKEGLHLVFR